MDFLDNVIGVIHVGAHVGQERHLYNSKDLNVLWIEAIKPIFEQLVENIQCYSSKQVALNALITDLEDQPYEFNISSNDGMSSSIFELGAHKEIWPDVYYQSTITLKSVTLPSLLKRYSIDITQYNSLVIDAQGAELLILKGSISILKHFTYVRLEAAEFESYKGSCMLEEIDDFLMKNGFREVHRRAFASHNRLGSYFDVTYASDIKTA